jgi:hypothetical protein
MVSEQLLSLFAFHWAKYNNSDLKFDTDIKYRLQLTTTEPVG